MHARHLLRSKKVWLFIFLLPFLLVACVSLFIALQPGFEGDKHVVRRSIATKADGMVQLSYLESGDPTGRKVIFVHGTPGEAHNWYGIMKNPPPGFRMIAIDRPGFGDTRPNDTVTSLMEQARALAPFIEGGVGKRPILVGHSLGGPIVAAAAIVYGDKLGGVVIAAGSLDPDLEEVMLIQRVGNMPPISWLLAPSYRNANRELIALETELRLLRPRLGQISVPVTIIHGTEDRLVPFANVGYMETEMTATAPKVIQLDGVNHFLPWNSGETIIGAIKNLSAAADAAEIAAHHAIR